MGVSDALGLWWALKGDGLLFKFRVVRREEISYLLRKRMSFKVGS